MTLPTDYQFDGPAHSWLDAKWKDLGPLEDGHGHIIHGMDPCLRRVGEEWWLHYTHGPSPSPRNPTARAGIWHRTAKSLDHPWSKPDKVILPGKHHDLDRDGCETFSMVSIGEEHFGIYHGYRYGNLDPRRQDAFFLTRRGENGEWSRGVSVCGPQYDWHHRHIVPGHGHGDINLSNFSECSIAWDARRSLLKMVYAAKAPVDGRIEWRIGRGWSRDYGQSWTLDPSPLIVPNMDGHPEHHGEHNMASHCDLFLDKYGTSHVFYALAGKVQGERGIAHSMIMGEDDVTGPKLVHRKEWVIAEGKDKASGLFRVGGPSVFEHEGKLWMAYHGQEWGGRYHLRLAVGVL